LGNLSLADGDWSGVESLSKLSSARDLNVKASGQEKIGGVVGLHDEIVLNFEAEGVGRRSVF
jgi:hypothetical protein